MLIRLDDKSGTILRAASEHEGDEAPPLAIWTDAKGTTRYFIAYNEERGPKPCLVYREVTGVLEVPEGPAA